MKRLFYSIAVMLCMGLVSCGKDGEMGPQGPMGEKGEQGIAGKDGATVLNGNTDPTAEQGSVGDFYINTSTYVLFGPKSSSGWGSGESILGAKGDKGDKGENGEKGDKGEKGEKGDKGEAEYVILSGNSDPTNSMGSEGDFYINRLTKTLHYRTSSWRLIAKLANTIQFTKEGVTLGATATFSVRNLPYDVLEKSMVHVYVQRNNSNSWVPLPGYPFGTTYFGVSFGPMYYSTGDVGTHVTFSRSNGTSSISNATIRIVVIEADVFHTVAKTVDFNNYEQVKQHFKLKD